MAAIKARRLDRSSLLEKKTPNTADSTQNEQNILVTTYHPDDNSVHDIVHANWDLLGRSLKTSFIHKQRPITAYRRPPNLRDLLVKADIKTKNPKTTKINTLEASRDTTQDIPTPPVQEERMRQTTITSFFEPKKDTHSLEGPSTSRGPNPPPNPQLTVNTLKPKRACTNPKCKYCPYLENSGQITCHLNGQFYQTKQQITCQSSNLIYGIECKRCGKHYVGQTKRPVYQRLYEHLRSINHRDEDADGNQNPKPVGLHFAADDHIGKRDLKIHILDFVHFHPDSDKAEVTRRRVEKKWIHRLRCTAPFGMNLSD